MMELPLLESLAKSSSSELFALCCCWPMLPLSCCYCLMTIVEGPWLWNCCSPALMSWPVLETLLVDSLANSSRRELSALCCYWPVLPLF